MIKALFSKQLIKSKSLRSGSIENRKKNLLLLEKWILKNRDAVEAAVNADFGKPATEVATTEIFAVLTELRFAVSNLDDWARSKKVDAPLTYLGSRSEVLVEPKGVCLIISPWNFPFLLAVGPLVSCLAAGNTAILKPSEITPHTSRLIKKMVEEIFDEELIAVVEGAVEATTELLRLPFDHIFFTGSPAVGKIVMKAAAENLTSVTLELGGKSPAIIGRSANLSDAAKRIAFGKFFNNGQTCIAPDYLLVDDVVADNFLVALKGAIANLFGKDIFKSKDYGRIANSNHFQRLKLLLDNAIVNGAKIEFGGTVDAIDRFIEPTILTNVPLEARIMQEEIFGPLLPIVRYKSDEEIIEVIDSKPKPLALYVFSNNSHFTNHILKNTSAGGVCVNECVLHFSHPNLPFGGVNNSGIGKSHGYWGFLAFSNEKPVLKQKGGITMPYFLYPPYTKPMRRIVDFMIRWL